MKYIKLPILWKDGDAVMLEQLGIDISYDKADTKDVYLKESEIIGFFPDKNPRFTFLYLRNTEMIVDMPIDKFLNLIEKYGGNNEQ